MLAWNSRWDNFAGYLPGKVQVIPNPDDQCLCNRHRLANTVGACMYDWAGLTTDQRLAKLFVEVWHIVCRDGVDPQDIHDALLVIPEYRDALSGETFFSWKPGANE